MIRSNDWLSILKQARQTKTLPLLSIQQIRLRCFQERTIPQYTAIIYSAIKKVKKMY